MERICYLFPNASTLISAVLLKMLLAFLPIILCCGARIRTHVTSVELHQTGTFEGRSTNWATAPRHKYWTYPTSRPPRRRSRSLRLSLGSLATSTLMRPPSMSRPSRSWTASSASLKTVDKRKIKIVSGHFSNGNSGRQTQGPLPAFGGTRIAFQAT